MKLISVHGGHSGEFCNHASNTLEEVVRAYIAKGFTHVGITEHQPAVSDALRYTDDREAGLTAEKQWQRFSRYMTECRRLQQAFAEEITLFAALETETCSGYREFVPKLLAAFSPDYIVGSVHHVGDINFDYSPQLYALAAEKAGGITELYLHYFDDQFEMLETLKPAVVGHFDLIRLFDEHYPARLKEPVVWQRIERNLQCIAQLGLTLDFNQRALLKGAKEPYISRPILQRAREMEIAVLPGDDSHGVNSVGGFIVEARETLREMGFSPDWQEKDNG
ncbi:MAG: histidinol-phosphatase [Desulforhopalus sp.]|nr:histidinol-phosphatase [Desulforhopalus sp.]